MKEDLKTKIFTSPAFLVFTLLLLIVILIPLGRETYRKYQIEKEIASLKEEIARLENNNQNLAGLLDYFKTEDYLEKEARRKLNLRKPGEKVIIIPPEEEEQGISLEELVKKERSREEGVSNPLKWWKYFFEARE